MGYKSGRYSKEQMVDLNQPYFAVLDGFLTFSKRKSNRDGGSSMCFLICCAADQQLSKLEGVVSNPLLTQSCATPVLFKHFFGEYPPVKDDEQETMLDLLRGKTSKYLQRS